MAVTSEWFQPPSISIALPYRTGFGGYETRHGELAYEGMGAELPALGEYTDEDGNSFIEKVGRWANVLRSAPESVAGADDPTPTVGRVVSRYSHTSSNGEDVPPDAPKQYWSAFVRRANDNFLTMWITAFPTVPVVPPEEIPEGASVEYESPAGVYEGDPVWTIEWAGRNHNSGGPFLQAETAEFFLHRLGPIQYPTLPSHKPPLEVIALTQPIVDTLTDATDSDVAGDIQYDPNLYTSKVTTITARPVARGQFAVTVRPRLWTGPISAPVPYDRVTSEPDGSWWRRSTVSYRTGRILSVSVSQMVKPPRYRFVWPGGQYRLRQRQTLPGSDGWPLRQRQHGAHSGSWPLRQRQTGV